jgi:hypothetical protein
MLQWRLSLGGNIWSRLLLTLLLLLLLRIHGWYCSIGARLLLSVQRRCRSSGSSLLWLQLLVMLVMLLLTVLLCVQ